MMTIMNFLSLPSTLFSLLLLMAVPRVLADPATLSFLDCFDVGTQEDQKFTINNVFGQILQNDEWGHYLNLTVFGQSPKEIVGLTNQSSSAATLFTTTSVLTLSAWSNSSFLCTSLRPPSPLPALDPTSKTFCPIAAGPFAFASTIPLGNSRSLTTLETRLRAVDPFGVELLCVDVFTTPLDPRFDSSYGNARILLWSTVALTAAYWVVVGIARIVSAWGRRISKPGVWAKAQSAGFILASAISGERLAASPALMRFSTPSMRDVIFHTQWCTMLAMVAVQWPQFVYPLLTQTAWSTLSYNITLTKNGHLHHWNPLYTLPFTPPENFADQVADPTSPLFIDPTIPNTIFTLPGNATDGISSFAYTLGIQPQDLFPICIILFLGIIGATIALSLFVWFLDHTVSFVTGALHGSHQQGPTAMNRLAGSRSPVFSKELGLDASGPTSEENKSLTGHASLGGNKYPVSRFALPLASGGSNGSGERGINSHRAWWRIRSEINTFHGDVLHGNLVRILVLFHLPVTIFSCYNMTLPRSQASLASIVLAAFSFAVFSLLIPAHLVLRVTFTTTNKLYDETRTLLSLGPLYNHYRHGSQMFASLLFATNIAVGVTVGAGQKSGTTQAIIILVVEVASALVTSIWLPWGSGASMGLISFLFCVARIVVAVLLVILTPTISIGPGPGGWVAYGILIILALVYLALFLMLVVKIIEAVVRISGGIGFDRSRHVVDSGLIGACGLLGCCGPRKRSKRLPKAKSSQFIPTTSQTELNRDSDNSVPPRFLGAESRKGSASSGPPPSVLRPEHVNRPYREDSDDEGYIMGAWKPFPRPGYAPVTNDSPNSPTLPKPSMPAASGFSRIGGGRAHIDTPYAITSGSTHTFPSIGQQSSTALAQPVLFDDDDNDHPPSVSSVARQPEYAMLPPGAMQPSHIRTKSQSAIIEDPDGIYTGVVPPARIKLHSQNSSASVGSGLLPAMASKFMVGANGDDDDDDDDDDQPKKKPWYHLRRTRAQSENTPVKDAPSVSSPVDEELGGLGEPSSSQQPQRSFVVIRKPQSSANKLNQATNNNTHPGSRPPTR